MNTISTTPSRSCRALRGRGSVVRGWPSLGGAGCPGCLGVRDSQLPGVPWGWVVPLVVWAVLRKDRKINLSRPKTEEEGVPITGRGGPWVKYLRHWWFTEEHWSCQQRDAEGQRKGERHTREQGGGGRACFILFLIILRALLLLRFSLSMGYGC